MAGEEDKQLKGTKAMIRSVLLSEKDGVPAHRFMGDYQGITGEQIPYRQLGFSSLDAFIRSIPDVVLVRTGKTGEQTYFAVADEATAHIQKLVSKQKTKKSKPLWKGPARYPKAHSQFRKSFTQKGGPAGAFWRPPPISSPFRPAHRSPSPGGAFTVTTVSPLMVTVRKSNSYGTDERLIERRSVGIGGGKKMATRALKAAFGEKGPDRKNLRAKGSVWNGPILEEFSVYQQNSYNKMGLCPDPVPSTRQYQLPPRFQRQQRGASPAGDRPVAVVSPNPHVHKGDGPALTEEELPDGLKSWVVTLLKEYPNGLWSTRFQVLYKEKFKNEAPSTLIDTVSHWTDVAMVEKNIVANRYVLYPLKDKPPSEQPPSDQHHQQPVQRQPSPPKQTKPGWQEFIVPDAELLPFHVSKYVYVSYMVSLDHFYVQDETSCVDDITTQLGTECQDQAVPAMRDLHPGVYCAALYSEDGCWYRARVCYAAGDTEIEVYFIDYGNVEKVSLTNIRCLTKETAEIPAQAISCSLFGLKPLVESGFSEEAMNYFNDFVRDQKIEMVTYSHAGGQCVVELFTEEAGDESLNQRLFEAGLVGTNLKADDVEEMNGDGEPPDLELPDSEYIEVVLAFMDLNVCTIRLAGADYSERLEAFEDRLGTLFKAAESSGKVKNLSQGSVCIASVDLLYHRVRILRLEEKEAQCLFVDHGYTEMVPVDLLQPLEADVNKTVPYQAIPCLLAGLAQFMKLPTTMRELITMSQNKICMAEIDCRDPLTVMLYDTNGDDDININKEIAKKLAAEGAKVDLDVFNASTDSVHSEGSGASSPRSQCGALTGTDVEQLQSATRQLSLVGGAGDASDSKQQVDGGGGDRKSPRQHQPPLYTWGSKTVAEAPVANSDGASASVKPVQVPEAVRPSPAASGGEGASQSRPRGALDRSDSLNVAYHTWPIPGCLPLPEKGEFIDVYIHWIFDPSNFVVLPHPMLPKLEKLMTSLNAKFQSPQDASGDPSQTPTPTRVPDPQQNHLYMALVDGVYYRAIYKSVIEDGLHIFCPDYCTHHLVSHDDLFLLPKQFWSLPFAAFRASLHGVEPTAKFWPESTKYKFVQLALNKTLVALIKHVEEDTDMDPDNDDVIRFTQQKLSLHLVDTSGDSDIVIADELVDWTEQLHNL